MGSESTNSGPVSLAVRLGIQEVRKVGLYVLERDRFLKVIATQSCMLSTTTVAKDLNLSLTAQWYVVGATFMSISPLVRDIKPNRILQRNQMGVFISL